MFKKLFGLKKEEQKKTEEMLFSPITGNIVDLEAVLDPTFSQKMMGDGLAIEPTEGVVVSPVNGEVIQFFHTKHAIGIRSESGAEILIHVGLETVSMNGEGFEGHVQEGDKVKVGQTLLTFNIDLIKEKAASTVTPVVITNSDNMKEIEKKASGNVIKGESEFLYVKANN
ncbi:PTS sugar transporter subunit IIA [Sutcliffiella cohnii]